MTALTARDRLERLLSIVPWVVANDGPTVAEIATRFDYPQDALVTDLNDVLFMVGTYPFTPDQLIEVVVDDDRVWIHYAEYFARPLRLTPDQALGLVTSGASLLAVPGADPDGPLARGLAKVAQTLGLEPGASIDVDLGSVSAETLATVREAIADRHQLQLEYYGYGRDELTDRLVDPYRVTSAEGQWYLLAHCHRAKGERLFRLDRIKTLAVQESSYDPPTSVPEVSVFEANPDDPQVVLRLSPTAAWVAQAYPVESVEHLADGGAVVTLAISAVPWLSRLLVRLGPDVEVESTTGSLPPDLAAVTARRILERYQRGIPPIGVA